MSTGTEGLVANAEKERRLPPTSRGLWYVSKMQRLHIPTAAAAPPGGREGGRAPSNGRNKTFLSLRGKKGKDLFSGESVLGPA